MKTDKLTVAFPLYERHEYFEEALLSVLNQTVVPEVIAVDNGSSHWKFKEICEKHNVKYYRNDKNIGLFPNWNRAMQLINSEYGMIFQDENFMKLDFVEEFLNILDKHEELDAYYTNFEVKDLASGLSRPHKHKLFFGYSDNGMEVLEHGILYGFGLPYNVILRVSDFDEYITDCHGSNDWVHIYSHVLGRAIYGNRKVLFNYGSHSKQDSKNPWTYTRCMLSLAYLLGSILSNEDKISLFLKKVAIKREREYFWMFINTAKTEDVKELLIANHTYGSYLRRKISSSFSYSLMLNYVPRPFRILLYSTLRKIGYLKGI